MGRVAILKKEETDYRKIDRLSYSALSKFVTSKKEFKKKYIDKEDIPDIDSDEIRMGSIVDVLLTDADNFHNIYEVATANKPTGQLLTFVEFLFNLKKSNPDESTIALLKYAYELLEESNGGKVRDKFETFVNNFNDKAIGYYEELMSSINKTLISFPEAELARKNANRLLYSNNTGSIIKNCTHSKFPILFDVDGVPMKAEIDLLNIDEKNKIIHLYDLKLTSFVDSFIWDGFIKRKYYIQSSLYKYALMKKYPSYQVMPMSFLVGCQINDKDPLVYETSEEWYHNGMNGFNIGKVKYKGVYEILSDIEECTNGNIWNMSLDNYKNNGVVKIPIFNGEE